MATPDHAAPATGEIVYLPLSALIIARDNPRKTKEKGADPLLVASIRSRGLLQNLGVRPSPTSAGKYEVKFGGRRLAALRALQKEGHFGKDNAFPCRIVPDNNAEAAEEQIAENIGHAAMNPIDEYEAFARLEGQGLSVEEIAKRFGADLRAVKQRLALGNAAPCVRKALREDEITLEIAKIFAGCPDIARQERVFNDIEKRSSFSAWNVKKMLHEGAMTGKDDIVRFVGVEAYEAAGGVIEKDLFNDEVRLVDPDLVYKLRDERLAAEIDRLSSEGWSWVDAHEGHSWRMMEGLDRLYGEVVPRTAEEEAEIARLKQEIEQHEARDEENWSDEDYDAYEALEERLGALQDVRREFTAEQKAVSGCIIYPSRNGIEIHQGLVKKEDRRRVAALKKEADARGEGDAYDGVGEPGGEEGEAGAVGDQGYGIGLTADLAVFKAQALQAGLAMAPKVAILAHQFLLVHACFSPPLRHFPKGSTVSSSNADLRVGNGALGETAAAAILGRVDRRLRTDIFSGGSWREAWTAFNHLETDDREALVACAFARTVEPTTGTPGFMALVAFEMGLDIRGYWKPTAENFFARIRKDQLIKFLKDTVGEAPAARLTNDFKLKKGELVALCENLIEGGTPAQPEARKSLDDWAPIGLAFDEPPAPAPEEDDFDDDEFENEDEFGGVDSDADGVEDEADAPAGDDRQDEAAAA